MLLKARWILECGDKITNKTVRLGAGSVVSEDHWFQKIGMYQTKSISPHIDVKKQVDEIRTYDPKTLHSFPTLLEELAKEIIDEGVRDLDIQLVFAGSEHLDDPTRALITKAFDAELFGRCGAREVGSIYGECIQHHGYHTNAELNVVEITRDGETLSIGEAGEVMVTNLENRAMPFIRYDLEDIGVLVGGECTCENCAPLMRITEGRMKDRIPLPDGRRISATVPIEVLRYIEGLRQFQLIQEARDRIVVQIIPGRAMADTVPHEIQQQLKPILENVEIEVHEVDHIPREKSGKLRQFISHVSTA